MSAPRRQGIGLRLVLPTALVTAILAAGLVTLQLRAASRRSAESLDGYADLVGGAVLNGIHDAMLADDRPRLKKQLARFSSSEYVRQIDIVDKFGRVTFSSNPDAVGDELSRDSPSCRACHDQNKPAATTGRTVHYQSPETGKMAFRFVQPVVAEQECLKCHDDARVGQNLGILITDLDEAKLIGREQEGARNLSWALAAACAVLVAAVAVVVRVVVVSRLRNVKRVVEFARAGALAATPDGKSEDEIDEIERLVQCLAEDLEDRHALDRATLSLAAVLEHCPEPVVLLDAASRVLGASPAFNRWPGAPANARTGQRVLIAGDQTQELTAQAQEHGWALSDDDAGPLLATVEDGAHRPLGLIAVWAPDTAIEGHAPVHLGRGDPEWKFYVAALASAIGTSPRRWRGVARLDRRLASGRKLLAELTAAAAKLAEDRKEVDLRSMVSLLLWDIGRQVPDVTWHPLLAEQPVVTGTRYQLRALIRRLGEAAATQAGPGGHVVLFTQAKGDKSRLFVGAWARSDEAPVSIDGKDRLPLCELLARGHGGGVEIDRGFDIGPLCEARGLKLPCESRGVLFVAELAVDGGQAAPAVRLGPRLV